MLGLLKRGLIGVALCAFKAPVSESRSVNSTRLYSSAATCSLCRHSVTDQSLKVSASAQQASHVCPTDIGRRGLQVPRSEGASPEEAVAAAREQIRIACKALQQRGFPVPDIEVAGEGSEQPAAVAAASSAMTASEQERFLSTMATAPPSAGLAPASKCCCACPPP